MTANAARASSRTLIFTTLALIAFAANSVLCRLALGDRSIDAASFTAIRLLSGAVFLLLILQLDNRNKHSVTKGSWLSGLMLFVYAATFSFAYVILDTATGALILFGSVQISMLLITVILGGRLHLSEWCGLGVAFTGLVYLLLPGVSTPSVTGFLLMTVAGIAWGIYTLNGRGSVNPLADTSYNFLRTIPLVLLLLAVTAAQLNLSATGITLAVVSGALASGAGYTLWYAALGGLSATQAAVVQLSVPVIAAFGGVIFVSEALTLRLSVSAGLILGGILLVILGRYYFGWPKNK